jgi:hypothetical protein
MALRSSGSDIGSLERAREQFAEALRRRRRAPVHEEARAAMLHQELTAAPTRRERAPVPRGHAYSQQPTVPTSNQGRDQPAFGAQGQAKRSVLDIAPADHGTIFTEPGGADTQARIGRVGMDRRRVGGLTEQAPVGNVAGIFTVRRVWSIWHFGDTTHRRP